MPTTTATPANITASGRGGRPVPSGPPADLTATVTAKTLPAALQHAGTQWTAQIWATLVLILAGVTPTPGNVDKILHWIPAENGTSTWYKPTPNNPGHSLNNPLNVAATTTNPSHGFTTLYKAAVATATELKNNTDYTAIYSSLEHTASLTAFASAVIASPWAAGHYGYTIAHITTTTIAYGAKIKAPSTAGKPSSDIPAITTTTTPVTQALHGLATPFADIGKFVGYLHDVSFWRRVGIFIAGAALATVGLVLVVSTTKGGQQLEQGAAGAALLA